MSSRYIKFEKSWFRIQALRFKNRLCYFLAMTLGKLF